MASGCVERFQVRMLQTGRDLVARDRPVLGKGLVAVGGVDFGPRPAGAAPETASRRMAARGACRGRRSPTTRSEIGGFGDLPAEPRGGDQHRRGLCRLPSRRAGPGAAPRRRRHRGRAEGPRRAAAGAASRHPRLLSRDRQRRRPAAAAVGRHAGRRQPGARGRDGARRRERRAACDRGADAEPLRHRARRALRLRHRPGRGRLFRGARGPAARLLRRRRAGTCWWRSGRSAISRRATSCSASTRSGSPSRSAIPPSPCARPSSTSSAARNPAEHDPAAWAPFVLFEG